MAAIDHLTPYLNRLVTLLGKNASAKLEIHCKKGQLSVNFSHEIGIVEETPAKTSFTYSDVLKSNSKLNRLRKRAAERDEKIKNKIQVAEKASEKKSSAEIETKCVSEQDNHEAAQANHKVAQPTAISKYDDDVDIFQEKNNSGTDYEKANERKNNDKNNTNHTTQA
jgi:hypothetical protein